MSSGEDTGRNQFMHGHKTVPYSFQQIRTVWALATAGTRANPVIRRRHTLNRFSIFGTNSVKKISGFLTPAIPARQEARDGPKGPVWRQCDASLVVKLPVTFDVHPSSRILGSLSAHFRQARGRLRQLSDALIIARRADSSRRPPELDTLRLSRRDLALPANAVTEVRFV